MDHTYLNDFYSNYDEEGRLLKRYGSVEFLTTTKYIDRYLKKGMKILEVGAGTGRYSLHYAKQGYSVDAVELVPHNIDVFKEHMTSDMHVRIKQGDACQLEHLDDNQFDITLVLGPLYHLYTLEDKRKAVSEALRVTKPGGILFFAFIMNDAVILEWGLLGGNLVKGKKQGIVNDDFHCVGKPELLFEMSTVDEIHKLMGEFRIKKYHMVASDGVTNHFREQIENAEDELFQAWLEYHFHTCEREDLIGYSNHGLFVGEKMCIEKK